MDLGLVIEPSALEESGFLLLGEVHGVRENPLVIRALMRAFGLSGLALEWPEDLASVPVALCSSRGAIAGWQLSEVRPRQPCLSARVA